MTTLEEAWAWYQATKSGADQLAQLSKHWTEFPWDSDDAWMSRLRRDNVLGDVQADRLAAGAKVVQKELDNLAILVLFSVFEANVRDWVAGQVRPEVDQLRHPSLRHAGEELLRAVAEGGFFRILESLKSPATTDLIEQVNQIRKHRNWVAHGRRADMKPEAIIRPRDAYQRLNQFLAAIRPPPPADDDDESDL